MRITVIITTYNRQELLAIGLRALSRQSYKNLQVIVLDNGSTQSVENILRSDSYNFDLLCVKFSENIRPDFYLTSAALQSDGDIVAFMADDDFLMDGSLKKVAQIFSNSQVQSLSTSFIKFDIASRCLLPQSIELLKNNPLRRVVEFEAGDDLVDQYCSVWGLGLSKNTPMPPMSHASTTFLRKSLIKETVKSQGSLFLGTGFGDVGILGTHYQQEKTFYLTEPLVLLCEGHPKQMDGLTGKSKRSFAHVSRDSLRRTPLKAITFANVGLESHLEVLFENKKYDPSRHVLTMRFINSHLTEILRDPVWGEDTERDLAELKEFLGKTIEEPVRGQLLDKIQKLELDKRTQQVSGVLGNNLQSEPRTTALTPDYLNLGDDVTPFLSCVHP